MPIIMFNSMVLLACLQMCPARFHQGNTASAPIHFLLQILLTDNFHVHQHLEKDRLLHQNEESATHVIDNPVIKQSCEILG
ncbi:hypothetical protein RB195_019639 [Necator americanus]